MARELAFVTPLWLILLVDYMAEKRDGKTRSNGTLAKKYTKKEKTAALKRLKAGESVSVVSREMNIPRTTLLSWRKSVEATGAGARKKTTRAREKNSTASTGAADGNPSTASGSPPFDKGGKNDSGAENAEEAKEQAENKRNFSEKSWSNIDKAQDIIGRRLTRALDQESAIDEIVDMVLKADDKDLSYQQKQSLLNKLRKIRVDDVRELVVLIGTLFDKQALANKDATSIVDGGIQIEFNIPRPPKKDEAKE